MSEPEQPLNDRKDNPHVRPVFPVGDRIKPAEMITDAHGLDVLATS